MVLWSFIYLCGTIAPHPLLQLTYNRLQLGGVTILLDCSKSYFLLSSLDQLGLVLGGWYIVIFFWFGEQAIFSIFLSAWNRFSRSIGYVCNDHIFSWKLLYYFIYYLVYSLYFELRIIVLDIFRLNFLRCAGNYFLLV